MKLRMLGRILVLIYALGLPMQTWAGGLMPDCMKQSDVAVSSSGAEHAAHADHGDAAADGEHCPMEQGSSKGDSTGKAKCSHCAAGCGVGCTTGAAALPSGPMAMPFGMARQMLAALRSTHCTDHQPDLRDRPPTSSAH